MEPLVLELIKHTPAGEGDTSFFLNAVTNFCLSIYSANGFDGPDEVGEELVLTLKVIVNTNPPRVKAHRPLGYLVPLGETNPLEAEGSYMVVRVVDQYDVEYFRKRFGGGTVTSQIEPDLTARPLPDSSFGSNGFGLMRQPWPDGNTNPMKNPC